MKIAYFFEIFYPEINGVITSTVNLALNLIENGHNAIFIAPKIKEFSEDVIHNKIRVFYLSSIPSSLYPGLRLSPPIDINLSKKLRKEKIDIVHITGPFTVGLYGLNFAKLNKIPVVNTFHTMITEYSYLKYLFKIHPLIKIGGKLVFGYMRPFISSSDVLTAPSAYVKKFIKKHFPKTEVIQISNGVELDMFREYDSFSDLKRNYPQYNNKSFIFIGRLGQEKSVDVLINAFYNAVREDREIKLFIIGSGPDEPELKNLVVKNDLSSNVFFLGKMEHSRLLSSGLLHHARAFVTASKTEVQPMTVIEAILAGLPIIIPDVEGIKELFHNNGKLFEADNSKELARQIVDIVRNDAEYSEYCNNSREMSFNFDGRKVAKQFETLYLQVIEQKRLKKCKK